MVLARGTSSPASMMLVASSTSPSPPAKRTIASSISAAGSLPWTAITPRSGTRSFSVAAIASMSPMRGTTTKLCPRRARSRSSAARSIPASYSATVVRIGCRRPGAVAITDSCCRPMSAVCSVRGIGVAVSVRTWPADSARSLPLSALPNRCSSSITTRPRSLYSTPLPATAPVPTTTCTDPSAIPASTALRSAAEVRRVSPPTLTPRAAKRRVNSSICWRARTVVGAAIATCRPASTAMAAARSATSVLPKPTSPTTSRSIGLPEARSSRTASIARAWSAVSLCANPAAKRS